MRFRSLLLPLAVLAASCTPPAPSPAELRKVEGELARIEQSKEFTSPSSLRIWLRGDSEPFTTWLPPAWDEDLASSTCAAGAVSLRVDRNREIWQISCRGRMLLSYERKVSLIGDRWHMGSTAVIVTGLLAIVITLLVLATRKRSPSS
ncbi:MAG: hypothetical protein JO040_04555 [Gemmatimonadetes bacterium]|nr:hypothetical protein [Gemmatimonadota bacterium]